METDPPTRLAVGCLENNVAGGLVDGRYWPGTTPGNNAVAREFAFIFKTPYTASADPALAVNMDARSSTPIMWVLTCARGGEEPWSALDQFSIIASHMPTPADVWTFNPTVVTDVVEAAAPSSFALLQNYPNPFNPSSDIRYQISEFSNVRLAVYDILGREVAVLVNEKKAPGAYQVRFDASSLSSGVYFYRLQVRPSDSVFGRDSRDGAGTQVETRKMLLLR
ncbi:MAG: T9SS type A sorting domain-containing protein [Ignavibacteriae bacterium]|nr:T9SS type A sorting domain-containing protein [Ignavibacteriota bacterium]